MLTAGLTSNARFRVRLSGCPPGSVRWMHERVRLRLLRARRAGGLPLWMQSRVWAAE